MERRGWKGKDRGVYIREWKNEKVHNWKMTRDSTPPIKIKRMADSSSRKAERTFKGYSTKSNLEMG